MAPDSADPAGEPAPDALRVDDFDFDLPPERIADEPVEPRDASRLLVYDRAAGTREHSRFRDLPRWLREGDLLVVNDTAVLPHRLFGRRASGGRVECLILDRQGEQARGYLKPARKMRVGEGVAMEGGGLVVVPLEDLGGGLFRFRLEAPTPTHGGIDAALDSLGRAPLPPYIARDGSEDRARDRERYQTVYARAPGAVAAPTAGLHFTPALLDAVRALGVEIATVTLHVGEGTFAPVRVDAVRDHQMHEEVYELGEAAAASVAAARDRGGRVIAVGTTAARTLETCAVGRGPGARVCPATGRSGIFLYPGRPLRVVDALITNFHLPRSTLVMLVAAMTGRREILSVYREAIERGYRFYSFGDAMFVC